MLQYTNQKFENPPILIEIIITIINKTKNLNQNGLLFLKSVNNVKNKALLIILLFSELALLFGIGGLISYLTVSLQLIAAILVEAIINGAPIKANPTN
jgi:hypothetical protein